MIITKEYLRKLIKEELEKVALEGDVVSLDAARKARGMPASNAKQTQQTAPAAKAARANKSSIFTRIAKALKMEPGSSNTDVTNVVIPGVYAIMAAVADATTGGHVTQAAVDLMTRAGLNAQQGTLLAMEFAKNIGTAVGLEEDQE